MVETAVLVHRPDIILLPSCKQAKAEGFKRMVCSSGGNAGLAAAKCAKQLRVPITIYLAGTSAQITRDQLKALVGNYSVVCSVFAVIFRINTS